MALFAVSLVLCWLPDLYDVKTARTLFLFPFVGAGLIELNIGLPMGSSIADVMNPHRSVTVPSSFVIGIVSESTPRRIFPVI